MRITQVFYKTTLKGGNYHNEYGIILDRSKRTIKISESDFNDLIKDLEKDYTLTPHGECVNSESYSVLYYTISKKVDQ